MLKKRISKLFIVLLSLLLLMPLLQVTTGKNVQASSDPTSMEDVAKNFSKYGSKFATSKKNYKYFDNIGNDWNYFGPANSSILNPSAKGENNSSYNALYSGLYNTKDHSMYYAARYAYAMNQAGLDHQSSSDQNIMHKAARAFGGFLVEVLLEVNVIVNKVLGFAYSIFRWINPFCAIQYLATNEKIVHGSIWKPVFDMVRPLYWAVGKITWVFAILAFMAGITFALAGFKINNTGHGRTLQGGGRQSWGALGSNIASVSWKFLKRAIVFLIGPILIGTLSNAFLNDIQTDTNLSDTVAIQQIYGNYVDFGDWADYSRLALPKHSGNSKANVLDPAGSTEFSSDYIEKINEDGANESTARLANNDGTVSKKYQAKAVSAVQHFMGQYITSASYTSSDWESRVKSQFRVQAAQAPKSKTSDYAKTHPIDHFKYLNDQGDTSNYNPGKSAYNLYDDKKKVNKNPYLTDYTLDYKNGAYTTDAPQGGDKVAALGSSKGAGLSTLGLYNYLNTNADSAGITYTTPLSFMNASTDNQHEAIGFVGRGFLFISTYLLMLVMMAASAMVMLFAVTIVLEGALSGIPNLLVYATEMATLHWQGFLGIIREAVVMYARLLLANIIVSLFTETVMRVFNEFDKLLLSGPHALFGSTLAPQLMPFGVSSNVLALVRLFESLAVALLVFELMRHYKKALGVVKTIMNNIFKKIGGTQHVGSPKPGNNSTKNSSKGPQSNMNSQNNNNDSDSVTPDDPYGDGNFLGKLKQDEADQDNAPDAANPDFKTRFKRGLAETAAAGLDKLDNSPAGQMAKNLTTQAAMALGGSKLGKKLGLEGRGDAAEKLAKLEKMSKQATEGMVDPKKVNNSAKATQTKAEQERAKDKQNENQHDAADDVYNESQQNIANARKHNLEQQKNANALDKQMDKYGYLTNPAKASQTLDAAKMASGQIAENKKLSPENRKKAAKTANAIGKIQDAYKQKANQAVAGQQKNLANAKKNLAKAKQNQAHAKRAKKKADARVKNLQALASQSEDKDRSERAKDLLPEAEQNQQLADDNLTKANDDLDKAKDKADKASVLANPALTSELQSATGKNLGANGANLVKASAATRDKAKDKLFTAKTGLKANKAYKATPEIMTRARNAQKKALETLNDPNSTSAQKTEARNIMKAADVVTSTGYQYKQFSRTGNTPNYARATKQEIENNKGQIGELQSIADTGYTISQSAPAISPMQQTIANQVQQAQQIVRTGTYTNAQGKTVNATPMQITHARTVTQGGVVSQANAVQTQMINTTSTVMKQAMPEARSQAMTDINVARAANNGSISQAQRQQIVQKHLVKVLQQPQYMSQLQSAGLVNPHTSTTKVVQQIKDVQELGNQQVAVMRTAMAPIRTQIRRGGFKAPKIDVSKVIDQASLKQTSALPAKNSWVDSGHYGQTTYGTVKSRLNELLKAQRSGSQKAVTAAREKAIRSGVANNVIHNVKKQRSVLDEIDHAQRDIRNQAMQHQQQMQAQL